MDGTLAAMQVPAERMGDLAVTLLQNAHEAAVRTTYRIPPIEGYSGPSVPIGQLALVEADSASTHLLVLAIGKARVGFQLPNEGLRALGAGLFAASATTTTKN